MKYTYYLFFCLVLYGCATEKGSGQKYLRWVGDIEHDDTLDAKNFTLCNGDQKVLQYFNMSQGMKFDGEKIAIERYFYHHYKPVNVGQSGWIRIRFIVNCQGQTGRFRMMQADENYKERAFNIRISDQLMEQTKSLKGWQIQSEDGKSVDYYQYLIFKINNGNIEKILP